MLRVGIYRPTTMALTPHYSDRRRNSSPAPLQQGKIHTMPRGNGLGHGMSNGKEHHQWGEQKPRCEGFTRASSRKEEACSRPPRENARYRVWSTSRETSSKGDLSTPLHPARRPGGSVPSVSPPTPVALQPQQQHCPSPSLLLQHLSHSLSALRHLYEQSGEKGRTTPGNPHRRRPYDDHHQQQQHQEERQRSTSCVSGLPPDPQTNEEAEAVLRFFCRELDMGVEALRRWREGVMQRSRARWHVGVPSLSSMVSNRVREECRTATRSSPSDEGAGSTPPALLYLEHVAPRVPVDVWKSAAAFHAEQSSSPAAAGATGGVAMPTSTPTTPPIPPEAQRSLYFYPRPQDTAFVQHCISELHAVVSPFITLSPPPRLTARRRAGGGPGSTPAESHQHPITQSSRVGVHDVTHGFTDACLEDIRPYTHRTCSTWYATQFIPAGMFVMSLPTAAGYFAHPTAPNISPLALQVQQQQQQQQQGLLGCPPPPRETANLADDDTGVGLNDPYLSYFQEVDDLVGQLCMPSTTDGNGCGSAVYDCVRYWKESVVPCRNLPFIRTKGALLDALRPYTKSQEAKEGEAELEESAALGLWSFFHETLCQKPLSPVLRAYFTGEGEVGGGDGEAPPQHPGLAEYHWWVSLVLSRRLGGSCLMPMVDKLNHDSLPNCFYSMADPVPCIAEQSSSSALLHSMTGIDVFHNLTAGVPLLFAYEPYVHVFTIRDVFPGEPLSLCYQSPPHEVYRPAHLAPFTPLRSLQEEEEGEKNGVSGRQGHRETLSSSSLTARLRSRAEALRLRHPGTPHVKTVEGQGSWRLQWGFVPEEDAVFSEQDLVEVGTLLSEKRVEERRKMFPKTKQEIKDKMENPVRTDGGKDQGEEDDTVEFQ